MYIHVYTNQEITDYQYSKLSPSEKLLYLKDILDELEND